MNKYVSSFLAADVYQSDISNIENRIEHQIKMETKRNYNFQTSLTWLCILSMELHLISDYKNDKSLLWTSQMSQKIFYFKQTFLTSHLDNIYPGKVYGDYLIRRQFRQDLPISSLRIYLDSLFWIFGVEFQTMNHGGRTRLPLPPRLKIWNLIQIQYSPSGS